MLATIFAADALFVVTNLDDIVLLTVLHAGADRAGRRSILAGQALGVAILTALSILGARGAALIPERYIGLLGVLPILLGVRAIFDRDEADDAPAGVVREGVLRYAAPAYSAGILVPV